MKKVNIVKKKYEFDDIIKNGKIVKNNYFLIYYKENNVEKYRFGISVSKKLGNAVFRNKYKRRIRNIVDINKNLYEKKYDYIIIMKKACIDADFNVINENFVSIIKYIKKET